MRKPRLGGVPACHGGLQGRKRKNKLAERRHSLSPGAPAGRAHPATAAFSRGTGGELPGAQPQAWPAIQRLRHHHHRAGAAAGARRRTRNQSGHYRGPLHGVPYAVKDLVAVKGYPTTWGARPYAKQVFDYNATIIERLNRAGAVLIGKAAMIELAGGLGYESANAAFTGPAKNPWNPQYWTCGSSAGSGAVVAAALAPWT